MTKKKEDPAEITPEYDVFQFQDWLDMPPEKISDRLEGKDDNAVGLSLGQVAALLEVERSGKNRADVVEVLCGYLGIKSPYEVTNAGPNYTNVVSRNVIER